MLGGNSSIADYFIWNEIPTVIGNLVGGVISGATVGVRVREGVATVSNAGTIAGGATAVALSVGYANRVIVDAGATFIGKVDGGNTVGADYDTTDLPRIQPRFQEMARHVVGDERRRDAVLLQLPSRQPQPLLPRARLA